MHLQLQASQGIGMLHRIALEAVVHKGQLKCVARYCGGKLFSVMLLRDMLMHRPGCYKLEDFLPLPGNIKQRRD